MNKEYIYIYNWRVVRAAAQASLCFNNPQNREGGMYLLGVARRGWAWLGLARLG